MVGLEVKDIEKGSLRSELLKYHRNWKYQIHAVIWKWPQRIKSDRRGW